MTPHRTIISTTALVLSVAGLAACSSAPSRSGSATDPVTITSGFGQASGSVGSDVLEHLADVTKDAAVRVKSPVANSGTVTEELDAVAALRAGDFDLTVVRADTLATAGADSLAVLQTPFLVTSEVQAARVVADPVAEDLMAGLDELGLVGIAMVPGGLRHPFGYREPLLGPDDYRGVTLNVRPGNGIAALVEGLGAKTDTGVDQRDEMAFMGKLRGIDTSLQYFGSVTLPAVLTSNVTLYTKFDVIVMDRDAWEGLSDQQQQALRESGAQAAEAALEERGDEDTGLARWCRTPGAESVRATDEQKEALEAELQPVVEAFTSAPGAADLAQRVRQLGEGTTEPAGAECGSTQVLDIAGFTVTPAATRACWTGRGGWRSPSRRSSTLEVRRTTGPSTRACGPSRSGAGTPWSTSPTTTTTAPGTSTTRATRSRSPTRCRATTTASATSSAPTTAPVTPSPSTGRRSATTTSPSTGQSSPTGCTGSDEPSRQDLHRSGHPRGGPPVPGRGAVHAGGRPRAGLRVRGGRSSLSLPDHAPRGLLLVGAGAAVTLSAESSPGVLSATSTSPSRRSSCLWPRQP